MKIVSIIQPCHIRRYRADDAKSGSYPGGGGPPIGIPGKPGGGGPPNPGGRKPGGGIPGGIPIGGAPNGRGGAIPPKELIAND